MPHTSRIRLAHDDARWQQRQLALLAVSALALLALFELTRADLTVARWFFDPAAGQFPLRNDTFLTKVMHDGAKRVLTVLALFAFCVCILGMRGRIGWLPRREAWIAALGMILIPALTSLLKQLTNRHCPWDITDFGGYAPYLGLLALPDPDLRPGVCFPAGHASTGYLWLVWAIALRPASVRAARAALWTGLTLGGALGLAQMLRGAHFLSHTLWTLWLAWTISVLLLALTQRARGSVRIAAAPPVAAVSSTTSPP